MSTWRQKAISCLPELKMEFESPTTSIYDVFIEMLPALIEAHQKQDTHRLQNIYDFAEWCFKQKEKDLWNAAGVSFYEHLCDYEETQKEIHNWVKYDIYKEVRALMEVRIGKEAISKLDKSYKARNYQKKSHQ